MRLAAQEDKYPDDWQTAIKFMVEPSFDMEMWMASISYTFLPTSRPNLGQGLTGCVIIYISTYAGRCWTAGPMFYH
jgi:hypothetical protein